MSSDGTRILVGDYAASAGTGRLYLSTNGGSTWSETQPHGNVDGTWLSSAMNSDGTKIIAGMDGGRLYLSTNGGSTWSETQPAGNANEQWMTISMSSNGQIIITGYQTSGNAGKLYLSTNGGSSWSETQPAGAVLLKWKTTSMSSDGTKIIAGCGTSTGKIYMSTNSGSNWSETQPAGAVGKVWQSTAMSPDGTKIIAAVYAGRVYISTNSGSTWSETQPAGAVDRNWRAASISSDGSKLLAGSDQAGRLYVSTNSGSNWSETQPNGNSDGYWVKVPMSSDGSKAFVINAIGRVYLNSSPLPVELTSFTASSSGSTITLQWKTATEVNNYGFEIERKQIPLNPPLQGGSRAAGEAGGFNKVGFVEGNGTTNSPKSYSFVDKSASGKTSYRLKQIDRDGKFKYSQSVEVEVGSIPKELSLHQNYPNPFNPATTIRYDLPQQATVKIAVYDMIGREVATLVNETKEAGSYEVIFSAQQLASGVYFYKLSAGAYTSMKKLMLMK
jgi:photosystem II stability/assembly factor-like uncharacterized protein